MLTSLASSRFAATLGKMFAPLAVVSVLTSLLVAAQAQGAVGVTVTAAEPGSVGDEAGPNLPKPTCVRTLAADVVALDQLIVFNRLGAHLPSGMIYALRSDVVSKSSNTALLPGQVKLRGDKRPRPLVLRMNQGDCLSVTFTNLLANTRVHNEQPIDREASMMVQGLSLIDGVASAGSHIGNNPSSLAKPGETRVYNWYAPKEGTFIIHSAGALVGSEGHAGQPGQGLFGLVHVEPAGSQWYRSQVGKDELALVTTAKDAAGRPRLNYEARYPTGHAKAGKLILNMLDNNAIVHSDLTAIIVPPATMATTAVATAAPSNNGIVRKRSEPFREFTIAYHDEVALVQAFDVLNGETALSPLRDNMAINYGSGGIGAEILSTGPSFAPYRNAVGPAANCNDCKGEEFFLSSWVMGDPATIVRREAAPAGMPWAAGAAIEALYQDDPSNVYHSYINDHVKFRIAHAGSREYHIHHLHAHQWIAESDEDNSAYLDSQSIGPGVAFSYDISYNGSGNRNKTVGDSIFHCHFYPHFAQGMWSLWRSHDVFEDGSRTLPDAELAGGTPTPALVPLPGLALAPLPTADMPGYPYFIPGVPGHRAPHPPLDTVDDGGLPRHVVTGGSTIDGQRGAFDRVADAMQAAAVPETGTAAEKAAMAFHSKRLYDSVTSDGRPAQFVLNGAPPAAGAPFADPCVDDDGKVTGAARLLKIAVHQLDIKFNKAGWHYGQSRMESLWADVADFQSGKRAPEPLFMRARSGDCITVHHTNLLPAVWQGDDFQMFTPTDIVGQHIHLVKFDVTASDGSANGFNYEDGTFAPDEVIERIHAINAAGGMADNTGLKTLTERAHPYFGVLGAQTTVQRWYADPVLNSAGKDRTLRTVFSHDHYGPSTHQQAGLYAGLVVEPAGSTWRDPETGVMMGDRFDGGPTSFRADILTVDPADSFREFLMSVTDDHLAYTADGKPIFPPGMHEVGLPHIMQRPAVPHPEPATIEDVGTMTVSYRNEPVALRVRDPKTNSQVPGTAGDLSHAFRSDVTRADPSLNVQPSWYPPLSKDQRPGDPYTPLLRAYEGDKVKFGFIVGSQEEMHALQLHGMRWKQDAAVAKSPWINAQMAGISEHFEMETGNLPGQTAKGKSTDYLYALGGSEAELWNGTWGLLRGYRGLRSDLLPLPSSPLAGADKEANAAAVKKMSTNSRCPSQAPLRKYDVSAVRAVDAIGPGLVYNTVSSLVDPFGLLYVHTDDLDSKGKLKPGVPVEPLVLRANAGDCIQVKLRNQFKAAPTDAPGWSMLPPIIDEFGANSVVPSADVGLHPQLVTYDVGKASGVNIGMNPVSTVKPGNSISYEWYAGTEAVDSLGNVTFTPVEFGACNLQPSDMLQQQHKGLFGALIVEPAGATWVTDATSRAQANVTVGTRTFREVVAMVQDNLNLNNAAGPLPPQHGDVEDNVSGVKAINYKSDPLPQRLGYNPANTCVDAATGAECTPETCDCAQGATNNISFAHAFAASTKAIGASIFTAKAGQPLRVRVLQAGGRHRSHQMELGNHMFRRQPANPNSSWVATVNPFGPGTVANLIPYGGAGGAFAQPGDYFLRDRTGGEVEAGLWSILRVTP